MRIYRRYHPVHWLIILGLVALTINASPTRVGAGTRAVPFPPSSWVASPLPAWFSSPVPSPALPAQVSGGSRAGGTLEANEVWSGVITVTGDLTVAAGVTLRLLPGTEVRFTPTDGQASGLDPQRVELIVAGSLVAEATAAPITFTSAASSPAPSDWYGLRFLPGSNGTLSGTLIQYGVGGVAAERAAVSLLGNTIRRMRGADGPRGLGSPGGAGGPAYGISYTLEGGAVSLQNNQVLDIRGGDGGDGDDDGFEGGPGGGAYGLYLAGSGSVTLRDNQVLTVTGGNGGRGGNGASGGDGLSGGGGGAGGAAYGVYARGIALTGGGNRVRGIVGGDGGTGGDGGVGTDISGSGGYGGMGGAGGEAHGVYGSDVTFSLVGDRVEDVRGGAGGTGGIGGNSPGSGGRGGHGGPGGRATAFAFSTASGGLISSEAQRVQGGAGGQGRSGGDALVGGLGGNGGAGGPTWGLYLEAASVSIEEGLVQDLVGGSGGDGGDTGSGAVPTFGGWGGSGGDAVGLGCITRPITVERTQVFNLVGGVGGDGGDGVLRAGGGGDGGIASGLSCRAADPFVANNLVRLTYGGQGGDAGLGGDPQAGDGGDAHGLLLEGDGGQVLHNTILASAGGLPGNGGGTAGTGFGLRVRAGATPTIWANIFVSHQVGLEAPATVVPVYNDFFDNGTDARGLALNATNLFTDPRFVDPAAGDYHLRLDSPLVDAGGGTALSEDFEGDVRPQDGDHDGVPVADIGYDEVTPPILLKMVSDGEAEAGDELTYFLVMASSSFTLPGAIITDRLPPLTGYQGGPVCSYGGCAYAGGVVTWTGTLLPGVPLVLSYTVRVTQVLAEDGQIVNRAEAYDGLRYTFESNPVTTTVRAPRLTLSKVDVPDPVPAGERLTYYLTVGNEGGRAWGLVVSDRLPAEATFARCSGGGGCGYQGGVVTWTVPLLEGGDELALTLEVTVSGALRDGDQIVNDGYEVQAPGQVAVGGAPVTTTVGVLRVAIEKRAWPDPVHPGEWLTYTLMITNEGAPLAGLVVSDEVPVGTTFLSCAGAPCREVDGTVTWGPDSLAVSSTAIYTLVVTVSPDLAHGDAVVNARYGVQVEGLPFQAGPPVTTSVVAPLLTLAKEALSGSVSLGSLLTYTLVVSNAGEATAGLVVTDRVPVGALFAGCAGAPCALQGDEVAWGPMALGPGERRVLTLVVTVATDYAGETMVNADYGARAPWARWTAGAPVVVTVTRPVLLLSKSVLPQRVYPGEQLYYTIRVTNTGEPAQSVRVTDRLPANTSFLDCGCALHPAASGALSPLDGGSCPGAICTLDGDQVVWQVPTMPGGGSYLWLTLVVSVVTELASGTVITNAQYGVSAAGVPELWGSRPVTAQISRPELHLSKTAWPSPAIAGGLLTYTLRVRNDGDPANSTFVEDQLPPGTRYRTCGGAPCGLSGTDEVVWGPFDMAGYGAVRSLTLVVEVSAPLGTLLRNEVYQAWAEGVEPVSGSPISTLVAAGGAGARLIYMPIVVRNYSP